MFHSLIADHPFGDGNKRTAVTALHHFLLANGVLLAASQDVMYDLALETASSGENNVKPAAMLRRIVKLLRSKTVQLSVLRRLPAYASLYNEAYKARRAIRNNPLNRP